ncbi:MAG: Ig-like domain-containing protein [Muribaculaceae bacterium]|nr:Ig-like domain-containing protein [Muribaculaceae bacterium]
MKHSPARTRRPRSLHPLLPLLTLALLLAACASMGNPSGGPRDEDPPRFVKATPPSGTRDFTGSRITLEFNELINVKDAFTKVVVSPPSASVPRVSSQGRRVTVDFRDTLLPNTTYSIDFANSIEDNNEGNKLSSFTYTFSTGPDLDTLRVSGMVLDALTLEPRQGILVGLHSDTTASAFTTSRFERMAKTDDRGRFTIYGLKAVPYRIYALEDKDGDMKYANPEEDLAFTMTTVTPWAERIQTTDTIFNLLTGAVDTVKTRMRTLYLPNDILLRSFNSGRRQQFVENYERLDSTRIHIRLNTPEDRLPAITFPDLPDITGALVRENSATRDTLTWWLPPALVSTDTIRAAIHYERLDSLSMPYAVSDTLRFITSRPRPAAKNSDKTKKDAEGKDAPKAETPQSPLLVSRVGSSERDVYAPVLLDFSRPVVHLDTTAIRVEVKADTLWQPLPSPPAISMADTLQPRRLKIEYPWAYGSQYRVSVDTLAAMDMYGDMSRPASIEFSTRPEEYYSSLTLTLKGLPDGVPALVQLLDASEKLIRAVPVSGGRAYLPYLPAGKYYPRVLIDHDGDGKWTPGDYAAGRLPETAYYSPKAINLRSNWDTEQEWDVFSINIDQMKPYAILKNKPERVKGSEDPMKRQQDEEDAAAEEEARRTGNYNPFEQSGKRRR